MAEKVENKDKRVLESITRDVFADQKRAMEKIAKKTRISVAEQMRAALDAYLKLPKPTQNK